MGVDQTHICHIDSVLLLWGERWGLAKDYPTCWGRDVNWAGYNMALLAPWPLQWIREQSQAQPRCLQGCRMVFAMTQTSSRTQEIVPPSASIWSKDQALSSGINPSPKHWIINFIALVGSWHFHEEEWHWFAFCLLGHAKVLLISIRLGLWRFAVRQPQSRKQL